MDKDDAAADNLNNKRQSAASLAADLVELAPASQQEDRLSRSRSRSHGRHRAKRGQPQMPWATSSGTGATPIGQQQLHQHQALLMPINELRVSGSKSEPPSRPSVDWSKQRPYFGPDIQRNVTVELGKTGYLTCKVYELGDKTVS